MTIVYSFVGSLASRKSNGALKSLTVPTPASGLPSGWLLKVELAGP